MSMSGTNSNQYWSFNAHILVFAHSYTYTHICLHSWKFVFAKTENGIEREIDKTRIDMHKSATVL
jgi:hypothetical protein